MYHILTPKSLTAERKMTLIHLSDLHIGYVPSRDKTDFSLRFKKIIERLTYLKEPGRDYVVVITGDIVDNANIPGIYRKARDLIADLENAGFLVLLVPGNHDYGNGILAHSKFVPRFSKAFYGKVSVQFPKLNIITSSFTGLSVAFIGLDSMQDELHWYDSVLAQGELGELQLQALAKMLSSDEVKHCDKRVVYLHHHPFYPQLGKQLKDSERFQAVLKKADNVDILLFGHNHSGDNFNGILNIHRCYDGGSATRKEEMNSAIRVMKVEQDARRDYRIEIITQRDFSDFSLDTLNSY